MAISQRLEARQTQALVMTPQLQQAIKLLQMSTQELNAYIDQEIGQNPLLDHPEDSAGQDEPVTLEEPNKPEAETVSEIDAFPESTIDDRLGDAASDADSPAWAETAHAAGKGGSEDFFSTAENVAESQTLRDYLLGQIHVDFLDVQERLIAQSCVDLLDEAGYLPSDMSFLCAQLGADTALIERVIAKLQRLDPIGIFARSLKECLAAQLREKNRLDPAMETLLDHLDLLARNERAVLMRKCGVNQEDINDMIAEIRALDPKPATSFGGDTAPPVIPDIYVRALKDGGWHVELNTENLPRVLVNERFYTQIQAASHKKEEKEYLAEHLQKANWLVKALHQRTETILKVSSEIVRQQDAFFVHGIQHLKPLVLRDIAQALELHESTVSRVTQNKYMATPRGLFELKYFFTTALGTTGGAETVSATSVKARIKALIDEEKPDAILSDDKLAELLSAEGIAIARRTIAKYREALHIPTSSQRRRHRD